MTPIPSTACCLSASRASPAVYPSTQPGADKSGVSAFMKQLRQLMAAFSGSSRAMGRPRERASVERGPELDGHCGRRGLITGVLSALASFRACRRSPGRPTRRTRRGRQPIRNTRFASWRRSAFRGSWDGRFHGQRRTQCQRPAVISGAAGTFHSVTLDALV